MCFIPFYPDIFFKRRKAAIMKKTNLKKWHELRNLVLSLGTLHVFVQRLACAVSGIRFVLTRRMPFLFLQDYLQGTRERCLKLTLSAQQLMTTFWLKVLFLWNASIAFYFYLIVRWYNLSMFQFFSTNHCFLFLHILSLFST